MADQPTKWAMERAKQLYAVAYQIPHDPIPHSVREIAVALDEARRQERKRCAGICVPYFTIPAVDAELDCDARKIFLAISQEPTDG